MNVNKGERNGLYPRADWSDFFHWLPQNTVTLKHADPNKIPVRKVLKREAFLLCGHIVMELVQAGETQIQVHAVLSQ